MTASALLKKVKKAYPDIFEELSKPQTRQVEDAILYASRLTLTEEVLTSGEHRSFLQEITGKNALTPGDRLKAYRVRQDLSQIELARRTGIPQSNLSALEAGKRSIGVQTAKTLAIALKCDFRRLL